MREAVITGARIAAAHEGVAELIVVLEHEGGGVSEVALDHLAASALLESCGAEGPEGLIGAPWQKVRDALGISWNRFAAPRAAEDSRGGISPCTISS